MWWWPVLSRLSKVCNLPIYRHGNVSSFCSGTVACGSACCCAPYVFCHIMNHVELTNCWVVGRMLAGMVNVVQTRLFAEST